MGRKGWGAYSVDAIAGGTYVADYTGEVLPMPEARRRVQAYDRDGLNYVLTTQEFFQGVSASSVGMAPDFVGMAPDFVRKCVNEGEVFEVFRVIP